MSSPAALKCTRFDGPFAAPGQAEVEDLFRRSPV